MGLRTLSLCAGGGGLDLALRLAVPATRTVCWVEWEAFAIAHLVDSMEAGWLDAAPLWTDLRTFDGRPWRGVVDCVIGGYPCQPFSHAGKRAGEDDPRHLWPQVRRVVEEVQPGLCVFENVAGHLSLGFDTVERELQELGYRVTAGLFTAAEVGAPHRRERLFIVAMADAKGGGTRGTGKCGEEAGNGREDAGRGSAALAHQPGLGWREGRAEPSGEQGRPDASERCSAVADPSGPRFQQAAAGRADGTDGASTTSPSGAVGDPANGNGRGRERGAKTGIGTGGERRGRLAGSSHDVADPGCQCGEVPLAGGEPAEQGSGTGVPVFPPGPGDLDGWRDLLTEYPDYAPAQSAVCLASHGVAATRRHWLRLLGNGVAPLQGAYAITTLLLAALHADSAVGDD